jgi:hypothetical protein
MKWHAAQGNNQQHGRSRLDIENKKSQLQPTYLGNEQQYPQTCKDLCARQAFVLTSPGLYRLAAPAEQQEGC